MSDLEELYGYHYLTYQGNLNTHGQSLLEIISWLQDNIENLEEVRKTKKLSESIHNLRETVSALHWFGAFLLCLSSEDMCVHGYARVKRKSGFHVCADCQLKL